MQLTSIHNPHLQAIRRAARDGRPTADGLIVAEGPHLLEEVVDSAWTAVQVFGTPGALSRFSRLLPKVDSEVIEVSDKAFDALATTQNTQGILALVQPRAWTWDDVAGKQPLIVVLDGIQDPGNVGTIARSAEAFGATGLLLAPGCAHVANGKVLRAAAGSLFRIPFMEGVEPELILDRLRSSEILLYALAAGAGKHIAECNLDQPCAFVTGNEGSGLASESWRGADFVSVPTTRVESLNAAVACSVALFEAARQRCTQ